MPRPSIFFFMGFGAGISKILSPDVDGRQSGTAMGCSGGALSISVGA
jgi:hypothetical protein